jgi:hypothetical protein
MIGLLLGTAAGLWSVAGSLLAGSALWPWPGPLGPFWPFCFALATTLTAGYGLSFVCGTRKSRDELKGLVMGLGRLGILVEVDRKPTQEEEVHWIPTDGEDRSGEEGPWR